VQSRVSVTAAAIGLIDAVVLAGLSHMEHTKSIRPSTLIGGYLFLSILFDAAQCRTLWLSNVAGDALKIVFTITLDIKILLLLLEMRERRNLYGNYSPEATSGPFSRGVFWWLNNLFWRGYGALLSLESLYNIDEQLRSAYLLPRIQKRWSRGATSGKHALAKTMALCLEWQIMASVFPRLCLIGFRFAQPFFVTRVIDYIGQDTARNSKDVGYGLIGAAGVIYVGLAISNGTYKHSTYRALTMVRGSLVSMIYSTTLNLNSTVASKEGSSALTLMSTDVERICSGLENAHEMWASPIEVIVAIYLLERQVGVACVVPGLVAGLCTFITFRISKHMGPNQKIWNEAVQKRIAVTSAVLSNMKEVKLLGLSGRWRDSIQDLREYELNLSKRFRKLIVYMNVNCK
jgi:ATP-binding cassette subfamily C (CFTR/MRP) protein 1